MDETSRGFNWFPQEMSEGPRMVRRGRNAGLHALHPLIRARVFVLMQDPSSLLQPHTLGWVLRLAHLGHEELNIRITQNQLGIIFGSFTCP